MLHRVFSKFFFPLQILQFVILSYKNFVWYKFRSNESYDVDAHIYSSWTLLISVIFLRNFFKKQMSCARNMYLLHMYLKRKRCSPAYRSYIFHLKRTNLLQCSVSNVSSGFRVCDKLLHLSRIILRCICSVFSGEPSCPSSNWMRSSKIESVHSSAEVNTRIHSTRRQRKQFSFPITVKSLIIAR